jgi:rhodanese-related sulfurtransferase
LIQAPILAAGLPSRPDCLGWAVMDFPLEVNVAAAARMLRDGALLLDVREPFELEIAALRGARHIPMRRIPESLADLPRDADILVLCHVGGRSARVTQFLRAQGFDRVANIAGGIDAWSLEIDPAVPRY